MNDSTHVPSETCACGRRLAAPGATVVGDCWEAACACGRRIAYEFAGSGWVVRATLTPEGSVPVRGFSRELRLQPDVERFWFLHAIGGKRLPVHVVFSPALRIAEIKSGDMKVLRLEGVESVWQARRTWVERHEAARRRLTPSASSLWSQFQPRPLDS